MARAAAVLAVIAASAVAAGCGPGESENGAPARVPIAASPSASAVSPARPYKREAEDALLVVKVWIAPEATAIPALKDRLLAEAGAAEDAARAQASADQAALGPSFRAHALDIVWRTALDIPAALSLAGERRAVGGGDRAETTVSSILWDRAAGREVGLVELFTDPRPGGEAMTALARAAREALAHERAARFADDPEAMAAIDESLAETALAPAPEAFPAFVLAKSGEAQRAGGLKLLYAPYTLGSYAEGGYELAIGADVFAPHLAARWAGAFAAAEGGEP